MNFVTIENYFKARIKEVEPKFKEHDDAFNTDNIGASKFNFAYHIGFGDMACSPLNQQFTTDVLAIEVELFMKGNRDQRDAMLQAYETSNNFRLNCMKPDFAMTGELIKNVVCTNIKSAPMPGNDNTIKMSCSFDVTMNFSTDM